MDVLRTPDERFGTLHGYPFAPHYADVDGLRMHYVDEGPSGAPPVLLLHGEPTWSYLYRTMIPPIAAAGHRVIAPDFIGFGRSDKLARVEDYSYQRHVDWTRALIESLDLRDVTLFGQDWGGLIGLRLAAEDEDRFARAVAANTFLPTGDRKPPEIWFLFKEMVRTAPVFDISRTVQAGCVAQLGDDVRAGYDAPFPTEELKTGPRAFPGLVPISPDDPASEPNRAAWKVFEGWEKPFLTLFGDSDPITRGGDAFFRRTIPGAEGQPHATIEGAGHFLQEDRGDVIAAILRDWLAAG